MQETAAVDPSNTKSPALPRSKDFPLVGSLPSLLINPFGLASKNRCTYGDIYELDLGMARVIILNHPRHAQYVLRDRASNYRKGGALWDFLRKMFGNGLVVSEGDFWLRQRRMMQPQFHHERLAALTDLIVEAIADSFVRWQKGHAPGAPINMTQAFNQLAMQVISKALFGSALETSEMNRVAEAMSFALDYLMPGMVLTSLPSWIPFPGKRRFQQSLEIFDDALFRIIAHGRRHKEGDHHLLAMLIQTVDQDTGEGMDDQQLRDEVSALFLAGYETTSVALSWAVDYLTLFPKKLQKLQDEVDTVLGSRRPTIADLRNLPYCRMVFQETLRIRPPSFWIPRVAIASDVIDGYKIPAGGQVISLTYMYHRHPDFWPNPELFDPERFTPQATEGRHRFAWVPFGAGQRLCIGRDLALLEGQLSLAMLVQRYRLERASSRPAELVLSSSLRPKHGVSMYLRPR
jgi:cytochrome P450